VEASHAKPGGPEASASTGLLSNGRDPLMDLSKHQCEQFLRANDVGRVVYTDRALPAVMPAHYAFVGGRVILRVMPDSRPAEKLPGSVVAFQVDDLAARNGSCQNVLVTGPCHRVSVHERPSLLEALAPTPWPVSGDPLVLEIVALLLTGSRRLTGLRAD
jgi:hypothetical protein